MSGSLPWVGISACLVGERVRYDGAHKRQDTLLDDFAGKVEWIATCPEVELGLGVPRETIQLEGIVERPRLVSTQTRRDLTAPMRHWARARLAELPELAGYVLKARSPSCGLGSAPLIGSNPAATVDGLWAAALRERSPTLPLAEEGALADSENRACFLRRIRACAELNELFRPGWTPADVEAFHACRAPHGAGALPAAVDRAYVSSPAQLERSYRGSFLDAVATRRPSGSGSNDS